jgi:hypothetical protein
VFCVVIDTLFYGVNGIYNYLKQRGTQNEIKLSESS